MTEIPEWAMAKALALRSSSDLLTDIAHELSQARAQAFEEAIKIVDGYGDTMAMAGEKGEMLPIAPFISQAIRQHSQKGVDK